MIPFNKSSITELEQYYINDALKKKMTGDGEYTEKASHLFCEKTGVENLLITTSGTHALELAAILSQVQSGDEVILPSYTFSSTANAFLLRGAKLVFSEIEPATLNLDTKRIEEKITPKTKVIVPVHYAGVSCDMDEINGLAAKHDLIVVEDAAQAVGSTYKGKPAGANSDMGCYSFHETKNYIMGEGGGITIRNGELRKEAEIIREKGTNRSMFIRGEVDKYTWHRAGSSYLPSDLLCAVLYAQMERFSEIMEKRMRIWNEYHVRLEEKEKNGDLIRPYIPPYCTHNAHMYYLIVGNKQIRDKLLSNLKQKGVAASFHYIPLHHSPMGESLGYQYGDLPLTESYSERLIRLPLWADMAENDVDHVITSISEEI